MKTIIWDLDGTLLDSYGIYRDIVEEVWKSQGWPVPSEDERKKHFHGTLKESLAGLVPDPTPDKIATALEAFLKIDNAYIKNPDDHLFADAVSLALRAQAAGHRQIIVTNRHHSGERGLASPRAMIAASSLAEAIDLIICSDECAVRKPNPAVLEAAGKIDLGNTVVIGDQFVDAEFAHNLAAEGIVVCRSGEMPHLERLKDGWRSHVTLVNNLEEVEL